MTKWWLKICIFGHCFVTIWSLFGQWPKVYQPYQIVTKKKCIFGHCLVTFCQPYQIVTKKIAYLVIIWSPSGHYLVSDQKCTNLIYIFETYQIVTKEWPNPDQNEGSTHCTSIWSRFGHWPIGVTKSWPNHDQKCTNVGSGNVSVAICFGVDVHHFQALYRLNNPNLIFPDQDSSFLAKSWM